MSTPTNFVDMSGLTIGRLRVVSRDGTDGNRQAMWMCLCACGRTTRVNGSSLRRGDTVSCGCYLSERRVRHGRCGTPEYRLWEGAKNRAKALGLEFNLTLDDITIPLHCPALGIPLQVQTRACGSHSPTLDRVDSSRGYTADNVRVLSHRANSIKRSATVEELEGIAAYMRRENWLGTSHERNRKGASGISTEQHGEVHGTKGLR